MGILDSIISEAVKVTAKKLEAIKPNGNNSDNRTAQQSTILQSEIEKIRGTYKTVNDGQGGYRKFDSSGKLVESLEKKDYAKVDAFFGPNYFPKDKNKDSKPDPDRKEIRKASLLTQYDNQGRATYQRLSDNSGSKLQETQFKYNKDSNERTEQFYDNNSLQRTEINTDNSNLKEGQLKVLSPEGRLIAKSTSKESTDALGNNIFSRHIKDYYENGNLKRKHNVNLNLTDRKVSIQSSKSEEFRPDGTKSREHVRSQDQNYVKEFDSSGNPLAITDFSGPKPATRMYTRDGSLGLPKDIEGLKKEINTPERYKQFESLIERGDMKVSDYVLASMVHHGYKLLSSEDKNFAKQKEQMEAKYGVKIRIGNLPPNTSYSVKPTLLSGLQSNLAQLDKEMQKYSPQFFQNAGLKNIYLHSEITSLDNRGTNVNLGGFFSSNNPDSLHIRSSEFFDHEMYHFLDHRDGGLSSNDRDFMTTLPYDEEENMLGSHTDYTYNKRGNKGPDWYTDPSKPKPNADPIGFGNTYGMTTVNEDQATIAEQALRTDDPDGGNNNAKDLQRRSKSDSTLAKKRRLIIRLLSKP